MTALDRDAWRDRLRDVVAGWPIGSGYYATSVGIDDAGEIADALLPVVRKIAADELRAMADELTDRTRTWVLNMLRDRADVLDPSATRAEP